MKKLLLIAVVSVVAAFAWRAHSTSTATDDGASARLVTDRIWIDHLPRNERENVNVFAVLSQHAAGVFQSTSLWRGSYERFRFEANGDALRVVFPQTGDREQLRARARKCDERGMDYCLEIEGSSRGVKKYYSREGWDVRKLDDVEALVAAIDR